MALTIPGKYRRQSDPTPSAQGPGPPPGPACPRSRAHQPDVVAGQVDAAEREHLGQEGRGGLGQLVAPEVQRGEALVGMQGVGECLAALILDAVEAQVEGDEVAVVPQGVSQRMGAGRAHLVVGEVEHAQAAVAQQLGGGARAPVPDEVVRQVQLLQGRVVQEAAD